MRLKSNLLRAAFLAGAALWPLFVHGYARILTSSDNQPISWDAGVINIQIDMATTPTLSDGTTFASSVQAAATEWNGLISAVQFSTHVGAPAAPVDKNGINEIGFDSTVYGDAFDADTLAVTMSYHLITPRNDGTYRFSQSDIIFNSALSWDSYRGALRSAEDIRRVALHELGHVLGLDHPDEASPPQNVNAIMNSAVSDTDDLTADDIAGAQSIYGGNSSPVITTQPTPVSVNAGQSASFTAGATGAPAPSSRWQREPSGSSTWSDLSDGAGYSGTTTTQLTINPTTGAMNGDQFRCVFTNSHGTTTTNGAVLTVIAAVAPGFTGQLGNASGYETTAASFSVSVTGTAPFTYHWQRLPHGSGTWADLANGGAYAGADTYNLTVSNLALAMNGDQFRCNVTNAAGSATSAVATLTVIALVPPVIQSDLFTPVTVQSTATLNLSVIPQALIPFTAQWYKNGVAISGATSTSFLISNCQVSDSGTYTVVLTNAAGSATSIASVVTVTPLTPPVIISQPVSLAVALGQPATFGVSATGPYPMSYQWYVSGIAIPGATSSTLYISSVAVTSVGSYTVKVTGPGGSVTSDAAVLSVVPAQPPLLNDANPAPYTIISPQNNFLFLSGPQLSGGAVGSYQWFKDGVALPNETQYFLLRSGATAADAGDYTVTVTNGAGSASSPDYFVDWRGDASARPWLDEVQLNNVVYFLLTSPGRIRRYDLVQEKWLADVNLTNGLTPTAFLPAAEGVYVAYDKLLVRRSPDLQTETAIATSGTTINSMFVFGNFVRYQDGSALLSRLRSDLTMGPMGVNSGTLSNGGFQRSARPVITSSGDGFTTRPYTSPNDILHFHLDGAGAISGENDSPFHGNFNIGTRQYLSPDETTVYDNTGVAYSVSNMSYVGSLGVAFDDLAFLADGSAVVLRGSRVSLETANSGVEIGRYTGGGIYYGLATMNSTAYAFGGTVAAPVVKKILRADFAPPPAPAATSPLDRAFSIDYSFLDSEGVIDVVSRSLRSVVRWDPRARGFVGSIPLRGAPFSASYAPDGHRLVLAYSDRTLTQISFPNPVAEVPLAAVGTGALGLVAMGSQVAVALDGGGADELPVIDAQGITAPVSTYELYIPKPLAWQPNTLRTYSSTYPYAPSGLRTQQYIVSAGKFVLSTSTSIGGSFIGTPRFNATGSLFAIGTATSNGQQIGPGQVVSADLQQVVPLSYPINDAAWLANGLYAIRQAPAGTAVEKYTLGVYSPQPGLNLPGYPLRIFRLDDNTLAVLTLVNGFAAFHVIGADFTGQNTIVNTALAVPVRPATFNAAGYLALNGDVAAAIGNAADKFDQAWRHYFLYGVAESRSDGDFNAAAYLAQYPSLGDIRAAALQWYDFGRYEGRRIPAGFDVQGYLARNADVAAAYGPDLYGAWLHFWDYGLDEGRVFDDRFRVDEYVGLYPDLLVAFGSDRHAALVHWLNWGRNEGRMGRVPADFDVALYLARYGDLASAFSGLIPGRAHAAAWTHYLDYGSVEGRSPDGYFEAHEYLAENGDLQAAFGSDVSAAVLHFYLYGRYEGRFVPAGFSATGYLSRYADLSAAYGSDLYGAWLHYWDYGIDEGRVYDELFRPDEYLAMYADLRAAFGTDRRAALLHWLRYGRFEGRKGRF